MSEYIERELLLIGVDGCISALHVQAKGDPIQESAIKLVEATRDYIASLSAADAVPVRHGRWIDAESDDGCTVWHCSKCSYPIKTICGYPKCSYPIKTICGYPIYKYCPMCGALMGEKEADHD